MTMLVLVASIFLPIYSQKSESPLHVAAIDTNTMAVGKSWEFPPSYTGHRSVCHLYGAESNGTFIAWTGGISYNPEANPFGTSRGYDYPVVEVTAESPITQRFDLWKTPLMLVSTTNTVSTTNMLPMDPTRIRVVRWKIDDTPIYDMAVTNRVVLDKVMDPHVATMLTEADFLDATAYDIDWNYFYSEVVRGAGVNFGNYKVTKADYLVFFGDGDVGWRNKFETNKWLTASSRVITRRFNTLPFVAVDVDVDYEPATTGSCGAVRWNTFIQNNGWIPMTSTNAPPVAMSVIYNDGFDDATFHNFLFGNLSNITFNVYGTFRMPPQSEDGKWRWWPPSSFFVPGRVFGICVGDAKFPPSVAIGAGMERITSDTTVVSDVFALYYQVSGLYTYTQGQFQGHLPVFCVIAPTNQPTTNQP